MKLHTNQQKIEYKEIYFFESDIYYLITSHVSYELNLKIISYPNSSSVYDSLDSYGYSYTHAGSFTFFAVGVVFRLSWVS